MSTASSTQKKKLGEILYLFILSFLLCLYAFFVAQPSSEFPEGLMNYPVYMALETAGLVVFFF